MAPFEGRKSAQILGASGTTGATQGAGVTCCADNSGEAAKSEGILFRAKVSCFARP
eukprot:CAMPEP_0179120384 /NCGR_PEP_ID=MMETSP0796-20121207/56717_1 /TAXON_ID=73915 /ORGANISM="Pyrodinium bahamense, Strain pbaha01" /LENGTH=55 /DNA_ID=CAMNT_0020818923 /DNA_START=81 /DNA_END=248 /DNA_ORIENTATION=-